MSVEKIISPDELVTSADIQIKYEHLYKFLMDFLWEFQVVQAIANLEIAIFKRFPDKEEMERCLRDLKREISYTYNELDEDDDVEFKEAVEDLEGAIEDFDEETAGCELYCVEEVVDTPDDIKASEEGNPNIESRKFKFGKIKKTTKEERELQEEAANTLSNPFEEESSEEE